MQAERGSDGGAADRVRLEEIADQLANLLNLAAKVGASDAIACKVVALEAEQREVERRLVARTAGMLDLDLIGQEIEVMVKDLRALLAGGDGRAVLKRLLGEERLRVRPDSERGFATEGEFSWLVGAGAASPEGLQRFWGSGDLLRPGRRAPIPLALGVGGVADPSAAVTRRLGESDGGTADRLAFGPAVGEQGNGAVVHVPWLGRWSTERYSGGRGRAAVFRLRPLRRS